MEACSLHRLLITLTTNLHQQVEGWGENDRGVSYTFGPDSVNEFLAQHDLDLICRAHQVWDGAPPVLQSNH